MGLTTQKNVQNGNSKRRKQPPPWFELLGSRAETLRRREELLFQAVDGTNDAVFHQGLAEVQQIAQFTLG